MTIDELDSRLSELEIKFINLQENIQELIRRIDALDYCVDTNQYYE